MMYNEIDEVKALAEIMKENGLTRVEIKFDEDFEIKLERAVCASEKTASAPISAAPTAVKEAADSAASMEIKGTAAVKSPMVGVFYSAPSPGEEPFVKVGDKVKKGDVLCIVEAMKLMNEIAAEQDGEIVEVCAEDGGLVEYGQTLFVIK